MSTISATGASDPLYEPDVMGRADAIAIEQGVSIETLVGRAAQAIADHLRDRATGGRVAILMGPGHNGWDGEAAIPHLEPFAAQMTGFALGRPNWTGSALAAFDPARFDVVVDALYGGGLNRDIVGEAADAIRRLNAADAFVLAVDLPSGIDGRSGAERGIAVQADETITFVARRPGHVLLPGREHCGRVFVAEIGMPAEALAAASANEPELCVNDPSVWRDRLPLPKASGHKFSRGHAVVLGGGASHSGAARLTATAALRGGAGLVTLLTPSAALLVNAAHLTAVMLRRCNDGADLDAVLSDKRIRSAALGPGFGVGAWARDAALAILRAKRRLLLDADGLTSFRDDPAALFYAVQQGEGCVLTPHEGEFARLFPDLAGDADLPKHRRALAAADRSGAVIVLKGADTVIASPDGRAAINATGTPWLATAGSGDVLAGLVLAQLSGGMPPFEAACAGVWMHGRASELFGPGLTAEDLPGQMPAVWRELAA